MTKRKSQKSTATAKKSFILYDDFYEQLEDLTPEQAGHYLKSIYAYRHGDEYICDDPIVRFALKGVLSQFKRDEAKYAETCARRSESGRKGGLAKQANARSAKQNKQKVANLADSDSDSDSDINSNTAFADWDLFLEKFKKATGKRTRVICDKTKRQFRARIKEGFTMEEIINASEACAKDDYHIKNPKYLTPEFITRSDILQKYLQAAETFTPFIQDGVDLAGQPLCKGMTRSEFKEKYGRLA